MSFAPMIPASEIPVIGHYAVWGPLGVMFGVGLWVFVDWYVKVKRPQMAQRAKNEEDESHKRQAYIETSGQVISKFAESHERQTGILVGIQETQDRHGQKLDEHGKRLSAIWRRLDHNPNQEEHDTDDPDELEREAAEGAARSGNRGGGRRRASVA